VVLQVGGLAHVVHATNLENETFSEEVFAINRL
jgi:hypothetical protein